MKKVIIASLLFSSFAMAEPKVLMIGTSHSNLGNTDAKTGVWLSELSHAYDEFTAAGMTVDFASIDGSGFPLDPGSLDNMDPSAKDFILSDDKRALLNDANVLSLTQAIKQEYDAVYLIGGHGVMWDFKGNEYLDNIIAKTYNSNGIIGAVCHGVAGLLTVKDKKGNLLIKDKKVTGFSDEEEDAIKLTNIVPFSLETELKKAKSNYSQTKENFGNYVVVDNRIVTGQNPASATAVARSMVNLLTK